MESGANKIETATPVIIPTQNGTRNGLNRNSNNNQNGVITNGTSRSRPEPRTTPNYNNNLVGGFADFDKADIFSASNTGSSQSSQQNGFADFEHNSVFNASSTNSNGMPIPTTINAWVPTPTQQNGVLNGLNTSPLINSTPPPVEDKYAALKDLDNEMKQQQQQDVWSSSNTGSTGSLYSSSTPTTGSVYGSPSPQGSIFGSPSQGQFVTAFTPFQENNPFGSNPWAQKQPLVNPFKEQNKGTILQPILPTNGITNGYSNGWGGNPFKVGTVSSSSNVNNPFL